MSRLFLTGDTHGDHDLDRLSTSRWREGATLAREDLVVVLGDFGVVFAPDHLPRYERHLAHERYLLDWLSTKKPFTTLFVDGNHENHDRLATLPTVHRFGADVGQAGEHVFHLRRGRIYDLCGFRCFVFGGAKSTDKEYRRDKISWWAAEEPSPEEMRQGIRALDAAGWDVDFVLSHDGPPEVTSTMFGYRRSFDALTDFFDEIDEKLAFREWFFGHHHLETSLAVEDEQGRTKRYTCLYTTILPVGVPETAMFRPRERLYSVRGGW